MSDDDNAPNPNGKNGKPIRIPVSFDEAVKAALETPPEPRPKSQPKKAKARTRAPRK